MILGSNLYVEPKLQENIFSVLARARLRSGIRSPLDALKFLTGVRGYKPLSSLPNNLEEIRRILDIRASTEKIIDNNTLLNLYRPFVTPDREKFILDGMKKSGSIKSRVGLLKSHCGAADQLAYCVRCRERDIFNNGFAYWRREHMLCGVNFCYVHHLPLNFVDLSSKKYGTRFLLLPDGGQSLPFTGDQIQKLLFVSQQVAILANSKLPYRINSRSYLSLLASLGLVTEFNHIRIKNLQDCVKDWINPLKNLFPFDQLYDALSVDRSWVANLVAGKDGMHHPLKHICLWGALNSDANSLMQTMDNSLVQLPLALHSYVRKQMTKEMIIEALHKYGSASNAAKHLGCSTTTLLVNMNKFCIEFKRKPKTLKDDLIAQVVQHYLGGKSTSEIALEVKISVPSANRIRRAYVDSISD
jgi:hypothetical protein